MSDDDDDDDSAPLQKSTIELEKLRSIVTGLCSNDNDTQIKETLKLHELLSIGPTPPTDQVITSGVVPRLIEFLRKEDFPQLQYEAAWVLTNIASGTTENTKIVVDHGVVPIFVDLLSSPSDDVREQAVSALANIARESPISRDLVLQHGALMRLVSQIREDTKLSMLIRATWALSIFCRGEPRPPFQQIKPALSTLKLLVHYDDDKVLANSCCALSYLSGGMTYEIQAVIDADICKRLVQLITHTSHSVIIRALRTVGNLAKGDDVQTEHLIGHGLLPRLLTLLTNNHETSLQKEACWTISNITDGNTEQIQAVIDAGLIAPLIKLFQTAEIDLKEEVAWAISNATLSGTSEQIKCLVSQGCLKLLCDLLEYTSVPRIMIVCLDGIEKILWVGEAEKNAGNTGGANLYAKMIDDVDGFEKIEVLQVLDDNEVHEKVTRIIETYWAGEGDGD